LKVGAAARTKVSAAGVMVTVALRTGELNAKTNPARTNQHRHGTNRTRNIAGIVAENDPLCKTSLS
jgi:hypothetical protein